MSRQVGLDLGVYGGWGGIGQGWDSSCSSSSGSSRQEFAGTKASPAHSSPSAMPTKMYVLHVPLGMHLGVVLCATSPTPLLVSPPPHPPTHPPTQRHSLTHPVSRDDQVEAMGSTTQAHTPVCYHVQHSPQR